MTKKLWGGRFAKRMDPSLKDFSYSLEVDEKLLASELWVNEAWVEMLAKVKILTEAESAKLLRGIKSLAKEYSAAGVGPVYDQYEDVHAFIQMQLENKVGP
ncbi:argininosuccinate lyase, partial [Omnitrophica bacterium]|nr:argininosuccinate lyase [Candidatus Omnitrophota bacterium]